MGCSSSKLDEEEAVRTCHDRKSFVKKAIAQRGLLASSHVAYIQALRRVSMALFYYFAEDEHLYFLQESAAACVHRPGSPRKVLVVNCLRPAGAPVHPVEQWEPEAIENSTIDRFFGLDHQLFHPSSTDPMNDTPVSPPPRWDLSWDPFSSLTDHHQYANYGVEVEEEKDDQEDEQIPELEEDTGDDDDDDHPAEGEAEEKGEQAAVAAPTMAPSKAAEEKKVDRVKNELRVMASADVEQRGTPGFTVYVDRPPTSLAEAMRDIQGHSMKIVEIANEVSVVLEVVPYQRRDSSTACSSEGRRRGARRPRGAAGAIRAVPEPQGEP